MEHTRQRQYLDELEEVVMNSIPPGIVIACYDQYRSNGGLPTREMRLRCNVAMTRDLKDANGASKHPWEIVRTRFYGPDSRGAILERSFDRGCGDGNTGVRGTPACEVPESSPSNDGKRTGSSFCVGFLAVIAAYLGFTLAMWALEQCAIACIVYFNLI